MSEMTPYAMVMVPEEPSISVAQAYRYSLIHVLTRTTGALYHSQNQECRIGPLRGQANIGRKIDDKCNYVDWSPAQNVGEVPDNGWSNAGYDHVRGNGEIDQLDGDA